MKVASSILVAALGASVWPCQILAQRTVLSAPTTLVGADSPLLPNYSAQLRLIASSDGSLIFVRVGEGRIDKLLASGVVRALARTGDGPGEFRMISAAGLRGDSLWVVDEVHRRLTILPRFGTGKPITASIGQATPGVPTFLPFTLFDDRTAWALQVTDEIKFNMNVAKDVPIVRTDHVGAVGRNFEKAEKLDIWSRTHMIELPGVGSVSYRPQMFSDRSLLAASSNGAFWAIINQGDPCQTPTARCEVTLFKGSGERLARVALPIAIERLEQREREHLVDSVITAMNAALRDRGESKSIESAFRRGLFSPQMRTPALDLLVADDGTMLIRGNDWARDSVSYTMLSAVGAIAGRFVVSVHQVVKAFTRSRVWSVIEDEDGQLRVVVQTIGR